MLAVVESLTSLVSEWLATFERALCARDDAAIAALFHADSHWRDVLALTWRIGTLSGATSLAAGLAANRAKPRRFAVDPRRTPPREVTRAGTKCIEAIFRFETEIGRGSGVLRLLPDGKAWTLLTGLDELKGHEERTGGRRPSGHGYSRTFGGPTWADLRQSARAYSNRDPDVLVVGGGQAGLSIAARLAQLDIDALIVDRWPRIGDNWRRRYDALTLHNQVHVNHLPYMPFPPNWPTYIPKDKLANWFEAYVDAMELNFWTGTEFTGGAYDEGQARWSVKLRRADGSVRDMHPRHVVMASGVSGIPNLPKIKGLKEFAGKVVHSSRY